MARPLDVNQLLQAAYDADLPTVDEHLAALEKAANALAQDLARLLELRAGKGTFQGLLYGGLCVPVVPKFEGQPIPECLKESDPGGGWDPTEQIE